MVSATGRQLTWESEAQPTLAVNNASGDVGFCGLWTLVGQAQRFVTTPRVSLIGPLRTRMGIGWLLRGLWLHPQIRHLVVWGQDLSSTGEALLKLWRAGLGLDGTIPGFGWSIYPEIERAAVDALRADVSILDWRGVARSDIDRMIENTIEYHPPTRSVRTFPAIAVPDQQTLPSRGTAFPIYVDDVGEGWIQLLNAVMSCGTVKGTRKEDRLAEILNAVVVIDGRAASDPMPECFDFDLPYFESQYHEFISPNKPEGVDYSYGERLQNWLWLRQATGTTTQVRPGSSSGVDPRAQADGTEMRAIAASVNQLAQVKRRLSASRDTKRASAVLLGPTDMDELDDAPCLSMLTFNVVGDRLFGSYVIRSNDIYAAWPFNALSLVRLQREIAEEIGLTPGPSTVISHSAHIYQRHWNAALDKCAQWLRRPLSFTPDPAGDFAFTIDDGVVRAQLMSPDGAQILWEREAKNPQLLMRDIVYAMPWLNRDHILYLGQEAQKLSDALRHGAPYAQG